MSGIDFFFCDFLGFSVFEQLKRRDTGRLTEKQAVEMRETEISRDQSDGKSAIKRESAVRN